MTRSVPRWFGAVATRARRATTLLLLSLGTACARSRGPVTLGAAPEPAQSDGALGVGRTIRLDSGRALASAPKSAATDSIVTRDSLPVSAVEVAREAARVFGDSVPVPLVDAPAGSTTTWDIDVRSFAGQERVAHFVELFTGEARERFTRRLSRGTRYDAMIRAKLKAGRIPEDMTYLALIESGYDPDAYSKAAAVGMWQFMSSTARGLGLRVDWWVDERRDPVRSTDAAVRFLNYLRQQFGSLYLAAAAYNGGPGRIARGLSRYADDLEGTTGDSLFFALAETDALRRETKDYVPQLVAAALVGKEPARYGVRLDSQPRFAYDSAMVPGGTPLAAVAKAAHVELELVRALNPGVLRGMTPPDVVWKVRVPVGSSAGFDSALAALGDDERRGWTTITSRKGQTMAGVAKAHGLTSAQLAWYNPKVERRKKTGALVVGQTLRIPTLATVSAARDVPDPKIEIYGRVSRGSRATTHVIREGETLAGIAKKYGTTVDALKQRNRMRSSLVVPGQRLVIRAGTAARGKGKASTKGKKGAASSKKPKSPKSSTMTKTSTSSR